MRGDSIPAAERTPVKVTRLFTGPDGKTYAEEIQVPLGQPSGATERSQTIDETGIQFRVSVFIPLKDK